MTVRKTIKWIVVLSVAGAACGLSAFYWFTRQSDELLREALCEKCAEIAPEWDIEIGRARFDWNRRVHVYNVQIGAGPAAEPILTVPEIVLTIDRERLNQAQEVRVHKVRLLDPRLNLVRDADGTWNWEALPPPKLLEKSPPEWSVERGTVSLRLENAERAAGTVTLNETGLSLIPAGKRSFVIDGRVRVNDVATVDFDGRWNLGAKTWTVTGRTTEAATGVDLVQLATDTSPAVRARLAELDARLRKAAGSAGSLAASRSRQPVFSLTTAQEEAGSAMDTPPPLYRPARGSDRIPDFGISATVDVGFQVSRSKPDAAPAFKLLTHFRQGQLSHPALPFPLHGLEGRVFWDDGGVLLENVTARNGITQLVVNGRVGQRSNNSAGEIDVTVSDLALDGRLQSRLPTSWRRIFETIHPTGHVDVNGTLRYGGGLEWRPEGFVVTFKGCTGTHARFPYTFTGIRGTLKQQGDKLVADLEGTAGHSPATLTGTIRNPGPAAETHLKMRIPRLALDDAFRDASPPGLQRTLKALKLRGVADVYLLLYRPPGLDREFQQRLAARLADGSLEYAKFPYRLSGLTGRVDFSSHNELWTFRDFRAAHGSAQLTGSGSFAKHRRPDALDLTVTAENMQLDKQLQYALSEPLRRLWQDLELRGRITDLETSIRWSPGEDAIVALPTVEVDEGGLRMKPFPYPLNEVSAALSYSYGQVTIESFSAKHEGTAVRGAGSLTLNPDRQHRWSLDIRDLYVDDLVADRPFRQALPPGLRTVIEELDPRGSPVSLSGKMTFQGLRDAAGSVATAWDLKIILSGTTVTAGPDLQDVRGSVTTRGMWDGNRVETSGRLNVDSVVIRGYELTDVRGPYRLEDLKLLLGSPDRLQAASARVSARDRVTARAVGGTLTLDGRVVFAGETAYRLRVTLSDGKLERYARRYMRTNSSLRGDMNAWVDLSGHGPSLKNLTGRGQLQISPAALYELPIIVQIFKVLSFVPPDKTAFNYALVDFRVGEGQVRFDLIDLAGDAISLRGRGTARFNGRLDLEFYSRMPRNRMAIPVFNVVVDEATKGWVGVKVRGTVDRPVAEVRAAPQIDSAVRRLLGAFEVRPPGRMPPALVPPLNLQPQWNRPRHSRPNGSGSRPRR